MKYRWKTRPYHHQVEAVKKLLRNGFGGALLMEPRTGKTKAVIDYASILHQQGHVNRVLVICPVGVMGVWEEEIPQHCPAKYRILIWDKRARKEVYLPKFGQDRLDFVIVNYDAGSTPGKVIGRDEHGNIKRSKRRGGRYEFKKEVKAWQPQLIILDESHRVKTPSALKSRLVHSLGKIAEYRVIMTGTVVTKKKRIYDVYSQWLFLNPKRFVDETGSPMTFAEFKDEFSVMTKRNGYPQWLRNKHEEKLHHLIHLDSHSVMRSECFDLPPLTQQVIPVHLYDSAPAYDQMAEDMVARIKTGEITEASIKLVQGLRLRQLTGGIARTMPTDKYPKGRSVIVGSEKLEVLEDRLEDLMEAEEHVIVGASFRPDITRLAHLCRKRKFKHFVVQGGVPLEDRHRMRREFESYDGGCVWISNPAAASEGIDLRSAAILIWYSLPTSWVHYAQFMDRNALHEGPRFVEYLLAEGADHLVYQTLMEDGDLAKRMIKSPELLLRESSH